MIAIRLFSNIATSYNITKIDIAFARFIADNISVLDFKTIDEVYHVLYHISQLLSVSAEGCQKYFDDLNKGVAVDRGKYLHLKVYY